MKKTKNSLKRLYHPWVIGFFFIGLAVLVSAGTRLMATEKPAVGKRIYVLDQTPNMNEVKIEAAIKSSKHHDQYMKDPKAPNFKTQRLVVRKMKKPKPQNLGIKPVELSFGKMPIKGKFTEPRLKFDQERLEVNRADESLSLQAGMIDRVRRAAEDNL